MNEQKYTSTTDKLIKGGLERLIEYQQTGFLYPQSLQLAPTDICNLSCTFCSVQDRNKGKDKPDELELEEIKGIIRSLYKFNSLKSVEITGGGDPTMYKDINPLIEFLDKEGLEIGLITNGVAIDRISEENLNKLSWLRISLSSLDPQNNYDKKPKELKIPKIKGTLGFSDVWGEYTSYDKIDTIFKYVEEFKPEYVRIVPDCFNIENQVHLTYSMSGKVKELNDVLGREVFFLQTKQTEVFAPCRIGYIKPFLNADGNFYHCSAAPLYEKKFTKHWRMGHYTEVDKIWTESNIAKGADTSICEYGKCFFGEQNKLIEKVRAPIKHMRFI